MSIKKSPLSVQPSASKSLDSSNRAGIQNKNHSSEAETKISAPNPVAPDRKIGPTTRISIQYDVGFSNALFLRGKGASLSWEKGIPFKNVKSNEWVWETTVPFTTCEFKVLINDKEYEIGDNHLLSCGASVHYTPKFH